MTATATKPSTNGQATDEQKEYLGRKARVDKLRANGWKVDLPGGKTATMRDPENVTEGQRSSFKSAGIAAHGLGERITEAMESDRGQIIGVLLDRQAAAVARMDWLMVAMVVESWTYDFPPPTQNIDSLALIPGHAYDALYQVAKDLVDEVFVDAKPTSLEVDSPFADSDNLRPTS